MPRAYDAENFEEERQIALGKAEIVRHITDQPWYIGFRDPADEPGEVDVLEMQLGKASPELRADPTVALACVRANGRWLGLFGRDLRRDPNIVAAAARQNRNALDFVDEDLRSQREFMMRVLKEQGAALAWASEELRSSKSFVMAVVTSCGEALAYASSELRADKEVVLRAVSTRGLALQFACKELKADREVALATAKNGCSWIGFVSPELRADKDFILQAARCGPDEGPKAFPPTLSCYVQAESNVTDAITKEEFFKACESNLAAPGERAPVLTVALSRKTDDGSYLCDTRLLSGASFVCQVPFTSDRPEPVVNDLATVLRTELPNHIEVSDAQYILIAFERAEGDSTFASAWDWDCPLSDFL